MRRTISASNGAATTVMLLLRYAVQIASRRIEGRAGTGIQAGVLDRLFRLPISFFANTTARANSTSRLINR